MPPLGEQELLEQLGDDRERWRGALAELVQAGFVKRADREYALAVPAFTEPDSEVLTPEVEAVIGPVVADVVTPVLGYVESLLDEMGYSHRRDYYPEWQTWLAHDVMGEALRFLMEQGVLPRPEEPAPATFGFLLWRSGIPLMSWGIPD